jgi:hypothetical protein
MKQAIKLASDLVYRNKLVNLRIMLQIRMNDLNDTFQFCTWYEHIWIEDRDTLS